MTIQEKAPGPQDPNCVLEEDEFSPDTNQGEATGLSSDMFQR